GTDRHTGLTSEKAEEKLARYGENRLTSAKKISFAARFAAQLKDFMIIILMIAAAISLITAIIFEDGKPSALLEPVIIVAIVIINALLGVFQESRAEAALEALQNMEAPSAKVIRDGKKFTISAAQLVPGDLIELEAGDYIPADARLVEVSSLHCNESSLTGESLPVEKLLTDDLNDIDAIADRLNMVYSGCSVTYGHGFAVVTETGMYTEMGKVAKMLSAGHDTETPLKIKLARLGKTLGYVVLGICGVVFLVGLIRALGSESGFGTKLMETFMTAVSLAVAAIPESLATIVTVVLALGVHRMATKKAIVRKLPAVETLGSASVICSDKTGTLTQNKMTLVSMFDGKDIINLEDGIQNESGVMLLKLSAMCCNSSVQVIDGKKEHTGDPTEVAISTAALNILGLSGYDFDNIYPRMCELPFDSDRKLMTTVNIIDGQPVAIVKGAPDILLDRCEGCDIELISKVNAAFATNALRVLAVAVKPLSEIPTNPCSEDLEYGLNFVGLLGMIDPPRKEAIKAISLCKKAGIRTVMITGDHILTATAIAQKMGILYGDLKAITGADVQAMTDDELFEHIAEFAVYARVTPEDKLRIVKAWQRRGDIVAMTGDSVNDAPALQAADIGCAMGKVGTDVAKGAADIVLTDDNFATIVTAVSEGRGIFDNIKKTVHFLLSCNLGEIVAVFFGMLIWGVSPFSAIQLLWINLVTDSAPAFALGIEPAEGDIMDRAPRKKDESIFAGGLGIKALWNGVLIGLLALVAYAVGFSSTGNADCAKTMAFAVMAFSQIVHAFNVRSSHSIFGAGLLANKAMLAAAALSIVLMLIILLVPAISSVFGLVALSSGAWAGIIVLSLMPLVAVEMVKAFGKIKSSLAR
ncbi:MAG: cation-translocating P-type ATPase, partial [Clostridia bacterium]|nr:cation-translocating P-type ATPase [Clostridia bacterium]